MPEYSEFRCANCESLIAGTPYRAFVFTDPSKQHVGRFEFCNRECFEAFKQKRREIPQ
jgi:hypothetical protein